MKFAAGVTLYNPAPEIIDNLKKTAQLFEILYVYDNSEGNNNTYEDEIIGIANIVYLHSGNNDGLSKAFNCMAELARIDSMNYLCTLDQDSVLTKDNVEAIEEYILSCDMSNIGAVAPFPTGTSRRSKKNVEEVEWVICSGCFIHLELLEKYGIRYDEAYFIDRFDADISMQIRRKGLKIIRLNDVLLSHRCGDGNGGHSDLRHYYMFRNRYYFNYKYYCSMVAKIRICLQNIRHFRWIIKTKEEFDVRYLVYKTARDDFKSGKLGKISNESIRIITRDRIV